MVEKTPASDDVTLPVSQHTPDTSQDVVLCKVQTAGLLGPTQAEMKILIASISRRGAPWLDMNEYCP